jgi:hypothetical protein
MSRLGQGTLVPRYIRASSLPLLFLRGLMQQRYLRSLSGWDSLGRHPRHPMPPFGKPEAKLAFYAFLVPTPWPWCPSWPTARWCWPPCLLLTGPEGLNARWSQNRGSNFVNSAHGHSWPNKGGLTVYSLGWTLSSCMFSQGEAGL